MVISISSPDKGHLWHNRSSSIKSQTSCRSDSKTLPARPVGICSPACCECKPYGGILPLTKVIQPRSQVFAAFVAFAALSAPIECRASSVLGEVRKQFICKHLGNIRPHNGLTELFLLQKCQHMETRGISELSVNRR
jgi:hypothetical protein